MMDKPGLGTLPSGQEGSITVMTALLMPTLVLMIMLVMNIGQLVFEKIRLQNVVDAVAYSAATVQAAGLNEIADLNKSAKKEYFKLLEILAKTLSTPFKSHSDGKNTVSFYKQVFDNIREYQDDANKDYARKAMNIARKVKKANLDEQGVKDVTLRSLNPKSSLDSPGKLMEYSKKTGYVGYLYWSSAPCVPKPCQRSATKWNDQMAGDAKFEGKHDGTMTTTVNSIAQLPGFGTVKYKISKKNSPTTYSAFELSWAPHDLVLGPDIFGRTEKLKAYAAAMPTGGKVVDGKPKYTVVLAQLGKLNPKPKADNLSKVLH